MQSQKSLKDVFLQKQADDKLIELAKLNQPLQDFATDLKEKILDAINRGEDNLSVTVYGIWFKGYLEYLPAYRDIHAICAGKDVNMAVKAGEDSSFDVFVQIEFGSGYEDSTDITMFDFLNNPPVAASANENKEEEPAPNTASPPPASTKQRKNGFF